MRRFAKLASWFCGVLMLPALATATTVSIGGARFSGGLGAFDSSAFVAQQAELLQVGDMLRFDVASIHFDRQAAMEDLLERTDGELTLTASFEFANPVAGTLAVASRGMAFIRKMADSRGDLVLRWEPLYIAFGDRGLLGLQLEDLVLTDAGPKEQTAVLTLLQAAALPEPGTLALIGLAVLAAIVSTAAARRGI
jgi:hypothetical protein